MKEFKIMVGLKKTSAFEGWFCKIDDVENKLMFSVIWGYSTHPQTKHAFIQFQDTLKYQSTYITYPIEELKWANNPFILQIGKNTLSETNMHLDFELNNQAVYGDFNFGPFSIIRKSFLKPNIMGWLSYFPNECNHAIISMKHLVNGHLQIGNRSFKIRAAVGYLEKDWGTSFPEAYVWVQANDWKESSLVFSYATVPLLGKRATGFFLVLQHNKKEYRFSSIEGSKMIALEKINDTFNTSLKKGRYRLKLEVRQIHPTLLTSPDHGEMKSHIKESLDGTVKLLLEDHNQTIVELTSSRASIDIHL